MFTLTLNSFIFYNSKTIVQHFFFMATLSVSSAASCFLPPSLSLWFTVCFLGQTRNVNAAKYPKVSLPHDLTVTDLEHWEFSGNLHVPWEIEGRNLPEWISGFSGEVRHCRSTWIYCCFITWQGPVLLYGDCLLTVIYHHNVYQVCDLQQWLIAPLEFTQGKKRSLIYNYKGKRWFWKEREEGRKNALINLLCILRDHFYIYKEIS